MLTRLVAFDTTSHKSNLAIIAFIEDYLLQHGVRSHRVVDESGEKACLYATIGPEHTAGVALSGHTDVVPVDGQAWSSDPFTLRQEDGKIYGRGACDMKGYLGCMLASVPGFKARKLKVPIHLAFSYDEEVGCLGVRPNLDRQSENLGQFADQMGRSPTLEESTFREKAVRFLREAPVFPAVAFLNDQFHREWVFPFAASRGVRGTVLKGPSDSMGAAKRAIKTGHPAASGVVDLIQGEKGVQVYAPVFQGSLWQGLVEGPIRVGQLAMNLIGPALGQDFRYSIIDERQGREIFTTLSPKDRNGTPAYDAFITLFLADRTWWAET